MGTADYTCTTRSSFANRSPLTTGERSRGESIIHSSIHSELCCEFVLFCKCSASQFGPANTTQFPIHCAANTTDMARG